MIHMDELAVLLSDQRRASYKVDTCLHFQNMLEQKNVWLWLMNQCRAKHEGKLPKKAPGRMVDTVRVCVE